MLKRPIKFARLPFALDEHARIPARQNSSAVFRKIGYRRIGVDAGNLFNVGDQLDLSIDEVKTAKWGTRYAGRCTQLAQVSEVRISGGTRACYCTDVGWFFPASGGNGSSAEVIAGYLGLRAGKAVRGFTMREQFNAQATITNFM